MVSRQLVDDFLGQKSLALAGVSRTGQGFGNTVRRELTSKGYSLYLIHPDVKEIDGQACYHDLKEVSDKVKGIVLVTPPSATAALVREAAATGIRRIWMQPGAESDDAIGFCRDAGLDLVHHECIMMFLESVSWPHRAHRWIRGIFGHLPR